MAKPTEEVKAAVLYATNGENLKMRPLLDRHPEVTANPAVLNAAALHGHFEIAKMLLQAGADPDGIVPSNEQYRPLHRAIEHRGVPRTEHHVRTARVLLEGGASPQARATWRGITPLQVGAMMGDPEFIGLLDQGSERDIYTAAILAEAETVSALLRERPGLAREKDVNGMTPLHYTALSGFRSEAEQQRLAAITVALLEAGADPNSTEKIGPYDAISVLHFAAGNDNFAVATKLLERGGNPDSGFGTCLWHDSFTSAELLLKFGADVNGFDSPGTPLLHSRLHWNLPKVVLWLLDHGADPNSLDRHGNTALHKAAERGSNPKVIEALLQRGARLDALNGGGETALEVAERKGKSKVAAQLRAMAT